MRLQFELSPAPLLKSGMGPLARYGTHQETISGRPEQKYLPSDPRSECPAEGPLFKPACFRKLQIAYLDREIKISTLHCYHENPKRGVKEKQVKRTLLG